MPEDCTKSSSSSSQDAFNAVLSLSFKCDFPTDSGLCNFVPGGSLRTRGSTLKVHKANVHNMGVKWHHCSHAECTYRAKKASALTTHKQNKHGEGVVWHGCDECGFKTKRLRMIPPHKQNKHGTAGLTWHDCDHEGCDYKAKQKDTLAQHKTHVHAASSFSCSFSGCSFTCRYAGGIKQHATLVHELDLTKLPCVECEAEFKLKSHLQRHMRAVHKREDAKRKGLTSLEGIAGQRITIGSLLGGGVATQGLYYVQPPPDLRSFLNYFRPVAPVGAPLEAPLEAPIAPVEAPIPPPKPNAHV